METYLIAETKDTKVMYSLTPYGAFLQLHKARTLAGKTPTDHIDFIRSATDYHTLTNDATLRTNEAGLEKAEIFPAQDYIAISKPNACYLLISSMNGITLKAGSLEQVTEEAKTLPEGLATIIAGANWEILE